MPAQGQIRLAVRRIAAGVPFPQGFHRVAVFGLKSAVQKAPIFFCKGLVRIGLAGLEHFPVEALYFLRPVLNGWRAVPESISCESEKSVSIEDLDTALSLSALGKFSIRDDIARFPKG